MTCATTGLVALKTPTVDGSWRTVLPPRPRTEEGFDSAGPLLRAADGIARPVGRRLTIRKNGSIDLAVDFRTRRGSTVRRGTLRFEPAGCGIRIHVPARRGERWEYSAFFTVTPQVAAGEASAGGQVVRSPARARVRIERGYVSAISRLVRARWRFAAARGPFTIDVCGA